MFLAKQGALYIVKRGRGGGGAVFDNPKKMSSELEKTTQLVILSAESDSEVRF